jgi:hypothetical protein
LTSGAALLVRSLKLISVKLTSILVNNQDKARRFYTDIFGFVIKHDIPMGSANG